MSAESLGKGLVILDRDGVINHDSAAFIKSENEWRPIPGSLEAIAALTGAGFTLAVASNQSGIARGLFGQDALDAMHAKMLSLVHDAGGHISRIARRRSGHRRRIAGPRGGCRGRRPAHTRSHR